MKNYFVEFKAFVILYLVTICFIITGLAMFSYQLYKWIFNTGPTYSYMTLGLKMVIISAIAIVIEFLVFVVATINKAEEQRDESHTETFKRDDNLPL